MKKFIKPTYNLCMEEFLMILEIYVTTASQLQTIIQRYTGPAGTKQLYIDFF